MKHIITLLTCLCCSAPVARADNAIEQWRALDYGMFISFGMSTFIADEYGSGKEEPATYAPTHLDVDQWIRVAKDAGMKYAVLTAKHSAGHCLWDSTVQFRGQEFDHDVASAAQRVALYDLIKKLRPGTIVLFNHGTAKPKGPLTIAGCQSAWPTDVLNTERRPLQPGWFKPEQTWQGKTYQLGYEHCDTICKKWFWVEGDRPRPVSELAQLYRDTHAAGGNLLLNVPPDRTGRIPEYHVKALMELKEQIK